MTASEPLSLEEEYGMQESWATDEDKLTFIVLSRPSANSSEDPLPLSEEIEKARMIGDVNMFFHEPEEEGSVGDAECEVMIAELDARRKGLAYEALSVFLRYATSPPLSIPTSSNLMAKISTSNPSSLGLFNKLGFQVVKLSEVWQEWELSHSDSHKNSSTSSSFHFHPSSRSTIRSYNIYNTIMSKASFPQEDPTIRRSHLSKDLVQGPELFPEIKTVYDIFPALAKRYGDKKAAAYRDVVTIVEEEKEVTKIVEGKEVKEKKTWKYFTLSEYKWLTYNQVYDRIQETASGLKHLGLQEGGRVGIYADTGVNWQIAAHGSTRALYTITTAYPTLGPSGLARSLTEPEVQAVFTNASLLSTLASVLEKGAKNEGKQDSEKDEEGGGENVRYVIYDGKLEDQALLQKVSSVLEARQGKLFHLDELRALGREHPGSFEKKPTQDDTFCIMYTSGSSGAPKGVILSHHNIISSLGGTTLLLKDIVNPEDTFLAFLPLSHVLELLVELTFYTKGTPVGYGSPKTLTDASVRNCQGDLKAFQPSIIVGVPAVFETIRKGIVGKINAAGAVTKTVFNAALALKKNVPLLGGVADSVVFSKIKEQTGGKLRIVMNGGSGLSKPTQEFLNTSLAIILQGYGLTETCGMGAILTPQFYQYECVGVPVPSVEIKLLDYPDAGYKNSNNPPQGEVLLRGGSVTKGYFKREDLNKEAFTTDGWFRTGDIGQWNKDGTLSLIDRIKNLVKLSSGEYIALENLESTYKGANFLNNICVYATSECNRPIALATLHEPNLRAFLKGHSISDVNADSDSLNKLAESKSVRSAMLKELNTVGKKNGLKGPETLAGLILDAEDWTPDNGLLTAAQKLDRKSVVKKHQDEIEKLIKATSS
ncbi:Acyl-CoA synthetase [Phaffia rhodozyma]|uniref:Acyl-CoA synthetase n=1 Tax=Phaffia rhodozyma TaxID=264483 RepID=A0A0F7SRA7_PHARH|nr:Acyl-CoA synthetase [Phaffia rhodozyma]